MRWLHVPFVLEAGSQLRRFPGYPGCMLEPSGGEGV